jgi:hypothetical protein
MFNALQNLAFSGSVGPKFISHDHPGHGAQILYQHAKEAFGRFRIAAALKQNVQHVPMLINSPPEVVQFAANSDKHPVQEPLPVHINSAEGFNDRIRRTVTGVFHHISPHHADLYFNEIGFRWSQRAITGQAPRRTRKGRPVIKTLWARIPPALQLLAVFRFAIGRKMGRTKAGGIDLLSKVAAFG